MSVVALDIGSSNIKALLARWDGQLIDVRSVKTPRQAAADGEWAYPAESVYAAAESLVGGIAEAHRADPIDTIVFSCLGTAMVPVDRSETPLGAALAPADSRPMSGPALHESVDLSTDRLWHLTGSEPDVGSSLLHLLWWRRTHPEVIDRLHRWRSLRGYVVQRLCGADAEDRSWASRTMLLDLEDTGRWSETILGAADLPGDVLPAIERSTATWPVERSAGQRFGLSPQASVVLGGIDNCCSLLGATDPDEPRLAVIVGTYEHIAGYATLDVARAAAGAADGVVHTFLLPDRYLSMTRKPLGHLLSLVADERDLMLGELLDTVSEQPTGARVDLDVAAVRRELRTAAPASAIAQGLLESATAVLGSFADAWAASGRQTEHLVAVGGGASRVNVLRLKANLLGRSISTLTVDEGAGYGALRLAALAVPDATLTDACRLFPNPVLDTWPPQST